MSRFSLINDFALVPKDAPFAILLRHAERGELKDGEVGHDCFLTPRGLAEAGEFGDEIACIGIRQAFSSPVPRCIDTAREIIKGSPAGCQDVKIKDKLGNPGIYIKDPAAATRSFQRYGNTGVIVRYVADGGLEGFMPLGQGSKLFLSDIIEDVSDGGARNIYVSHDMILIPMISHFTGEPFDSDRWLDFLDGFIIYRDSDGIWMIRKGKAYAVTFDDQLKNTRF